MNPYRILRDSMGTVQVPAAALWGAQTERARKNFSVSGLRLPRPFIRALGLIKASAASANAQLKLLEPRLAAAISRAALQVADGLHDDAFPLDVFQTGSGTSSNMNANEVIATLASRALRRPVHPNDQVNFGQSSNDVIPTAIHVAAVLSCEENLLPALAQLERSIRRKGRGLRRVVKTGRTHLMDAMPLSFEQELSGWAQQIANGRERVGSALLRLRRLPQGGTAVGTGINRHPQFPRKFVTDISRRSGCRFTVSPNYFESLSAQDAACELSGQLKVIACSLMKISNDLRWMNSGPLAGLGEIELPALQPGSSIMPGKINPVIPEAACMAAAQVIGNDAAITVAAQSGNFQLNVMLPLIAHNLLQSIELLANISRLLADRAIAGFTVREDRIATALERNPVLITALNAVIGYEKGAAIAKKAYNEGRAVLDVAMEETGMDELTLKNLLDPQALTTGGIKAVARSGGTP